MDHAFQIRMTVINSTRTVDIVQCGARSGAIKRLILTRLWAFSALGDNRCTVLNYGPLCRVHTREACRLHASLHEGYRCNAWSCVLHYAGMQDAACCSILHGDRMQAAAGITRVHNGCILNNARGWWNAVGSRPHGHNGVRHWL